MSHISRSFPLNVVQLLLLIFILVLPATSAAQGGLTGWYYSAHDWSLNPTVINAEEVGHSWGNGAPLPSIPADRFYVRWRGSITPLYSERYTLSTYTDDGVRLWIGDQLLIDNWTNHGPTIDRASLQLQAGTEYIVRLEYFEQGGGATCELRWESESQVHEVIPSNQLLPWPSTTGADGHGGGIPDLEGGEQRVGLHFSRSFIIEGQTATLSIFRFGDLTDPLTVSLQWSEETVERFFNLPESVTIPAYHSTAEVNIRLIDDLEYQGTQNIQVIPAESESYLLGAQGEASLTLRDNDPYPPEMTYIITGDVNIPNDTQITIIARQLNSDITFQEVLLDSGIYSLGLPEGNYTVTAEVKDSMDQVYAAHTEDGLNQLDLEFPPNHYEVHWMFTIDEPMTGGTALSEGGNDENEAGSSLGGFVGGSSNMDDEERAGREVDIENMMSMAGDEPTPEEMAGTSPDSTNTQSEMTDSSSDEMSSTETESEEIETEPEEVSSARSLSSGCISHTHSHLSMVPLLVFLLIFSRRQRESM